MARKYRSAYLEAAERIHADAVAAIRAGDTARYGEIADLYEELMMAFPRTWQEYGERYIPALAQGLDFLGPLQHLTQNLFEELALAIREGRRESAFDAAGVPFRIAIAAADLGATALVRDMLRLQIEGYRLASETPGPAASEVKSQFGRHLVEFCSFFLSSRLEDSTLSHEARGHAAESMIHGFRAIGELLRLMLERKELGDLRDLDGEWSEVLRFWEPDVGWDYGDEHSPSRQQMVGLKMQLTQLRSLLRFGLALWALRLLTDQVAESWYSDAFLHFGGHFGSVREVLSVGALAFGSPGKSPPWNDWILFTRAERAGFIDTTTPALRAWLVLMALRTDVDRGATLTATPWLHDMRESLIGTMDSLKTETSLAEVLAVDRWVERLDEVKRLIESAAQEREARLRAEIAESRADPEKVAGLREATRAGWARHRLGHSIHDGHGQAVLDEGVAPEVVWGHSAWLPKDFFFPERHIDLHFAEDLGRSVADGEMDRFADALGRLEPLALTMELRDFIVETLGIMREEEYEPLICVMPVAWQLRRYLFDFEQPPYEQAPQWVPEGARHWFAGETLGLWFFNWPRAKTDRLYIVDPGRFSRYKGWTFPDGHELRVDVREFGSEEALDLARRKPAIMSEAGDSPEERALEIRQHVYLDVRMKFEIEVLDSNAGRAIVLPPDLHRE